MNLFARIVSHGFALAMVALLALGLVYRGELFPEWELPGFLALGDRTGAEQAGETAQITPAPVAAPAGTEEASVPAGAEPVAVPGTETGLIESQAESPALDSGTDLSAMESREAPPTDLAPMAEAAPAAEAVEPSGTEATPLQEDVVPAEEAPPAAAQQPAVTSGRMSTGDFGAATAPAALPVEAPPAVVTAADGDTSSAPAAAAAAAAEGEPAAPGVATHAAAAPTPYQVLAAAREAYWLRDYAVAEQKYQALIALDPGNPDGYGELGNMYFSQGDWEKASAAYYEAGTRLTAQGMHDRARQLVEVIRGLNGEQADDLEQQISAAESAAP